MSISINLNEATVAQIKARALTATGGIAVFAEIGKLKSCFANTVECTKAIKNRDVNYLFTLRKQMSIDEIDDRLKRASNGWVN